MLLFTRVLQIVAFGNGSLVSVCCLVKSNLVRVRKLLRLLLRRKATVGAELNILWQR